MAKNDENVAMANVSPGQEHVDYDFGKSFQNEKDTTYVNDTAHTPYVFSDFGYNKTSTNSSEDVLKVTSASGDSDDANKFYYGLLSDNDGDTMTSLSDSETESVENDRSFSADDIGQTIFSQTNLDENALSKSADQQGTCEAQYIQKCIKERKQKINENEALYAKKEAVPQSIQIALGSEKGHNSSDYDNSYNSDVDVAFRSKSTKAKRPFEERYSDDISKQIYNDVFCSVRNCAMNNSYTNGKASLETFIVSDSSDLTVIDIFSLPEEFVDAWNTESTTSYVNDSDKNNKYHTNKYAEQYLKNDAKYSESDITIMTDSNEVDDAESDNQCFVDHTHTNNLNPGETFNSQNHRESQETTSRIHCKINTTMQVDSIDQSDTSFVDKTQQSDTLSFSRRGKCDTILISDTEDNDIYATKTLEQSDTSFISITDNSYTSYSSDTENSDSSFTSVTDDDNVSLISLTEYYRHCLTSDKYPVDPHVSRESDISGLISKTNQNGQGGISGNDKNDNGDLCIVSDEEHIDPYQISEKGDRNPSMILREGHSHTYTTDIEYNKLILDTETLTNALVLDGFCSNCSKEGKADVDYSEYTTTRTWKSLDESTEFELSCANDEQSASFDADCSCVPRVTPVNSDVLHSETQSEVENTEISQKNVDCSKQILSLGGDNSYVNSEQQSGDNRKCLVCRIVREPTNINSTVNTFGPTEPIDNPGEQPGAFANELNDLVVGLSDVINTTIGIDHGSQPNVLNDVDESEEFHENYALDLFFREDTLSDLADEINKESLLITNPPVGGVPHLTETEAPLPIYKDESLSEDSDNAQDIPELESFEESSDPSAEPIGTFQQDPLVRNHIRASGKLETEENSDHEHHVPFYTPPSYDESTIRKIHERLTNEGLYDISKPIERNSKENCLFETVLNKIPPLCDKDCDSSQTKTITKMFDNVDHLEYESSSDSGHVINSSCSQKYSRELFLAENQNSVSLSDSQINRIDNRTRTNVNTNENRQKTPAPPDNEPGIYDVYPSYDTDDDSKDRCRSVTLGYMEKTIKTARRVNIIDKICKMTVAKRKDTTGNAPVRIFRGNPIC